MDEEIDDVKISDSYDDNIFDQHSEPVHSNRSEKFGLGERIAILMSYLLVLLTFPLSILVCIRVIQDYERAVLLRLGIKRKGKARGPGLIFILPCIDVYIKIDLRTQSFNVPPQEVLTKDSVTVSVDAVVFYRIGEPLHAVTKVVDYIASTHLLAATTMRSVLGTHNLYDLLSDRETISRNMRMRLDGATIKWGVIVERVEIKDVCLPMQLQRAMAAEAEAGREARAKIIAAEGEIKASKALLEASRIMTDNPMALQLRYLQSLSSISATNNSTIIFPFPIEFLTSFGKK